MSEDSEVQVISCTQHTDHSLSREADERKDGCGRAGGISGRMSEDSDQVKREWEGFFKHLPEAKPSP